MPSLKCCFDWFNNLYLVWLVTLAVIAFFKPETMLWFVNRSTCWVQQWLLNFGPAKKMTPDWFDWPVNEQYIDFAVYPLHNETCFNQTTVPAACYWFWLHTRPEAGK